MFDASRFLSARLPIALVMALCASMACGEPSSSTPDLGRPPSVDELLAEMTLEEKIGQMTQVELTDPGLTEQAVRELALGSVLSGGTGGPVGTDDVENWSDAYDRMQTAALETRLGIPILYGIDAVHGHNNVIGAVIFPHNIGMGATRNPALVEEAARITAIEMRATGIQWNFSPCLCVARDERWGRSYEAFSEEPELAAELGAAAIRGYQTGDLRNPTAVLATAKHFLADGGTVDGDDRGDAVLSEDQLRAIHLPPYEAAVDVGVGAVMASFSSWNGDPVTSNGYLLTDLLKDELGFDGLTISDWKAIRALPGTDYADKVERAVNAGLDMAMVVDYPDEFVDALTTLVETGRVPEERIDDAVRRILRAKIAMGLLDESPRLFADRSLHERVGSADHRSVARRAVRESLVLLKNEGAALPLDRGASRIHVAGKNADDLGHQCGGWTISWQGESGDITEGTTILEAIEASAGAGTEVTFSMDGSGAEGADVGVVVIGEEPYAESHGDRADLSLDAEDVAAVEAVAATGIPVVVVLVSGRPMILGDVLDTADAIVAAWLPGTEGSGVADVLFGDHAPTGKLSFSWPRSMEQIPINVGDEDYDPLYPFGFGLTYE